MNILMSKSRLEKFLYALYSLDTSDLPNPLSRIEELYKYWVTGEKVPSFKPLSRVEKYLMVILGLYDLETQVEQRVLCTENNDVIVDENENYICLDEVTSVVIPAPISRIEKLLYKLATCDDNLDDIKSFLSEHEELLAEIIRNGGAGGNINIEYVLYTLSTEFNTLYNTAEKPVKSAILKGNTILVNEENNEEKIEYEPFTLERGYFNLQTTNGVLTEITDDNFADSTTSWYTPVFNRCSAVMTFQSDVWNGFRIVYYDNEKKPLYVLRKNDNPSNVLTLSSPLNAIYFRISTYTDKSIRCVSNKDYLKLHSVKMPVLTTTGKNMFNPNTMTPGYFGSNPFGLNPPDNNNAVSDFIPVKPSTKYVYSFDGFDMSEVGGEFWTAWFYYTSRTEVSTLKQNRNTSRGSNDNYKQVEFTTPADCNYVRIGSRGLLLNGSLMQFEEAPNATSYEPYKSNILTVNEDVTLRGIGGAKDTLNCLTGEVVERIGEIVLDGTQDMVSDGYGIYIQVDDVKRFLDYTDKIACDKLPVVPAHWDLENVENGISGYANSNYYLGQNWLYVKINNSINTDEAKEWMAQNPITVQYQRVTNSIKTVDLSVVDQDGNNAELSTFDDITHVTLSSEGLISEVELEVATKNEEVLNTMSLEMDDISTSQNTLEETANTQSENVDSTMMATTEIYEELL